MRLYATKTSLYRLASDYVELPVMRSISYHKADRRPDYWLDWGYGKAYFATVAGRPLLSVTVDGVTTTHVLSVDMLRSMGMVRDD